MTGADVQRLREQLGLTPAQLAELLGTSLSSIYRWEANGQREIAIDPFQLRILTVLTNQIAGAEVQRQKDIADGITKGLLLGGGLLGLYYLLDAVFNEETMPPARRTAAGAKKSARARSTSRRRKGGGKR